MTRVLSPALLAPGPTVRLQPDGFPERLVSWGQPWQVGTAAYWIALTKHGDGNAKRGDGGAPRRTRGRHRLGRNLAEEVAACLLGGYGMPHQVGLAAFEAVRSAGLLNVAPPASAIEDLLSRPLEIRGRHYRYRFPAQRGRYLAAALARIHDGRVPEEPTELRDWLLALPGVGPKTACWIVRNHHGTDVVAIIDVHVLRAARHAGVFAPEWKPDRQYALLEAFFLDWARAGEVSAADLDAVIWQHLSRRF